MASSLAFWLFAGKDPAANRLDNAQKDGIGNLITYRSEDPVSKSNCNVSPPITTGQRYSESYSVGDATTVPSAVEAASATSAGMVLPNLRKGAAMAAGPDLMKPGFLMT